MRGLPLRNFCDKREQKNFQKLLFELANKVYFNLAIKIKGSKQMKFVFGKKILMPSEAKISHLQSKCGNSSVGRAQPCQGWGRGFESRFPLAD